MEDRMAEIVAWYQSQGITLTLAMVQIIRGSAPPWASPWPRRYPEGYQERPSERLPAHREGANFGAQSHVS